ncbi:heme lyase NrfEFG subunit NrfG [Enterobacteriaceae bacterium 4M9]|nr:heme lyase NrfEFG subunit NrfG [Enterobacteriaceae bacterium 4M9]
MKRTTLAVCLLAVLAYASSGRWHAVYAWQTQAGVQAQAKPSPSVPRNGDDWARVGDEALWADRYDDALYAYQQALRLRGGDARLYAAYGTALYWQAGQVLTPLALEWLNQALEVDPLEVTALMLLASEAFMQADYAQAITLWKKVLESPSARVSRERVIEAIQMAQRLGQQESARH